MKSLSKFDGLNIFIEPDITGLITYIDNHGKEALYSGSNIHYLYCYLYIIGDPTILIYSSCISHYFGTKLNIDILSLNTVHSDLIFRQRLLFEFCGSTGYKYESFIIIISNILPPSILIKKFQYNPVHKYKPNDP